MNNINNSVLQRYDCDGIELVINTQTGESFASQSGYARMANVTKQAISARIAKIDDLERSNSEGIKEAQIQTTTGLKTVKLINGKTVIKWLVKDNPELLAVISELGWNVYCHKLAGFQVTSEAVNSTNKQQLIETASFAIDWILKDVPIRSELKAGAKLSGIEALAPELKPALEPSRQLLINNTAQPHQLLTPTEIGKRLGISGQKVNQLLIEKGLQVKNLNKKSKKEADYLPTDRGQEFCDLTLSSGKNGDSSSYQQLRWYESVLAFF